MADASGYCLGMTKVITLFKHDRLNLHSQWNEEAKDDPSSSSTNICKILVLRKLFLVFSVQLLLKHPAPLAQRYMNHQSSWLQY